MASTAHKIHLLESLEKRLADLPYADHATLEKLFMEIRIVVRRSFGEDSVYWHDLQIIRFYPDGIIGVSTDIYMTSVWRDGKSRLTELLRAMKTELTVFGEARSRKGEITVPWLLTNLTWELWVALGTLLLTAVSIGIGLGQTTFVKEFIGK